MPRKKAVPILTNEIPPLSSTLSVLQQRCYFLSSESLILFLRHNVSGVSKQAAGVGGAGVGGGVGEGRVGGVFTDRERCSEFAKENSFAGLDASGIKKPCD